MATRDAHIVLMVLAAHPQAADKLAAALGSGAVACVVLVDAAGAPRDALARLIATAQARGVAALIERDADLAKRLGADGVHLAADEAAYAQARRVLGATASIGVAVGASRHDAMVLGELGAEYVAFGGGNCSNEERDELIAWWAEIFNVPCVAIDVTSPAEAAELAGMGADFVALAPAAWMDAADPARYLAGFRDAIAAARQEQEPA